MIYFVQGTQSGNIKIGQTDLFRRRFMELDSSDLLMCLGIQTGDAATLADIHTRFKHLRVHKEWFKPGTTLLEYIGSLPKSAYINKTQNDVGKPRPDKTEQELYEHVAYDLGYAAFDAGKTLRDAIGLGDKGTPGYTRTLSMWKWGFEQASQGIPNRNKANDTTV